MLGVATAFFFVLAYAIFMAADAARVARSGPMFGVRAPATPSARRYFTGRSPLLHRERDVRRDRGGASTACCCGRSAFRCPIVWAILAFVTNFVPNIGFVLGLIPPAVLALVVGGWQLALVVVLVYSVVNVVLQVLVQPKFVSDAVSAQPHASRSSPSSSGRS